MKRKTNHKQLGTKRIAEVLAPFAGSEAEWYMTATQPLPHEAAVATLELVVWQPGQELGRWPLHAMAYGSLVSGLVQQSAGPFAIPHAKDFFYDDYAQVGSRLAAAKQVLAELIPPYNALLHRMGRTERMEGLSASQVKEWLQQAERTLTATKGQALKRLMDEIGSPRYASHSSYLLDLLPVVQQRTQLLKNFLIDSLPPTSPPGAQELATVGAEHSKWDWVELGFRKRGVSSELTRKMYEYLPEVKLVECSYNFPDEEPEIESSETQFPSTIARPSENTVRAQLLEIRQRIDDLLASLD